MNLVVDTNILFTLFWKKSFTRKLILNSKFKLFSPELALKEIIKHKEHILKKAGINESEFDDILTILKSNVKILSKKEYLTHLEEALKISPDKADSEFLALCIKLNCPLWSNDSILKSQNKVVILSTHELISTLF